MHEKGPTEGVTSQGLVLTLSYDNRNRLLLVRLDVANSITYSLDLLCIAIRNLKIESLLELHDKLYLIQRVSTKMCSEACLSYNL